SGNVSPAKSGAHPTPSQIVVNAQNGEVTMKPENLVQAAVLTGDVHLKSEGAQPAEAWAGRARMEFVGRNVITKVHADEQVRLLHIQNGAQQPDLRERPPLQKNTQHVEVSAPAMDFFVAGGNRLARAETSGSPRIVDSGMQTTARNVRLNRATGEGFAEGDVKTTYNELKPQPGGALLASSDPIHVTAQSMIAHSNSASATYKGKAQLWQNAN